MQCSGPSTWQICYKSATCAQDQNQAVSWNCALPLFRAQARIGVVFTMICCAIIRQSLKCLIAYAHLEFCPKDKSVVDAVQLGC